MVRKSVERYSKDYWTLKEIIEYSKTHKIIGPFSVTDNANKVAKKLGMKKDKQVHEIGSPWYVIPKNFDKNWNEI
jgi:hypothetical protein